MNTPSFPKLTPKYKWDTCIHEAGHAVVARALGFKVNFITAIPDLTRGGYCEYQPTHRDNGKENTIAMAGLAANIIESPEKEKIHVEGARTDIGDAYNPEKGFKEAVQILNNWGDEVDVIAEHLQVYGTITNLDLFLNNWYNQEDIRLGYKPIPLTQGPKTKRWTKGRVGIAAASLLLPGPWTIGYLGYVYASPKKIVK